MRLFCAVCFLKALRYTVLLVIIASCSKEQAGSCFKSTGSVTPEMRNSASFDSILVDRRIELILVQDTQRFVVVEAGEHLLPLIKTTVKEGRLEIRNENKCNWVRSYDIPVKVYIHHDKICHILSMGSSRIQCTDTIRYPNLTLEFRDASSDVDLRVNNHRIGIIQHTGASDIRISGKTDELAVYMSSLAWGDYRNLYAGYVYVESRSAADCSVRALDNYYFKLRAAGNIYYTNSAPISGSEITGSGKLIPINP